MKKIIIISSIFSSILILLSAFILCVFNFNFYTLSPDNCRIVFGVYPEEFNKTSNYVECTYYSVDSEGNLNIVLSNYEAKNFKKQTTASLFSKGDSNVGTKIISEDYSELTIKCYKETCVDDTFSCVSVIRKCVIMQFLNGKNLEAIKVKCNFVDAVTDEVKYQLIYSSKNSNEDFLEIDPNLFSTKSK